jgi:hypothetical protein
MPGEDRALYMSDMPREAFKDTRSPQAYMGHGVLQARGRGVLPGMPRADVYRRTGTVGRDSKRGVLMRGWEIKPIGVLVVFCLIILVAYTAYKLFHLRQSRDENPPDTQS